MRNAARAIVIRDDHLLVIHRNKFGAEYRALPGGKIELGESPEQALVREVNEETMVEIANPRFVLLEHAGEVYGDQYIFYCDYVAGEPMLHPDSEELKISTLGKNLYQPMWVALKDLKDLPFLSENLKLFILKAVEQGWPDTAVEITTK